MHNKSFARGNNPLETDGNDRSLTRLFKKATSSLEFLPKIAQIPCMVDFRKEKSEIERLMVPPAGVEPAAPGLGNLCSILLS